MKKYIRYGVLAAVLMVFFLGGCKKEATAEPDGNLIGSGLEFGTDQMVITISNEGEKRQYSLDHFTAAVRQRHPEVRLVQTGYAGSYENLDHLARVEGGDISDIVMVKAGRKAMADLSPYLMDLSAQAFPGNYNSSSLEKDSNGRIYYIPGPLSLNGIIYNKTLFEERGWEIPKSYKEVLELSQQIDNENIRGHQYPMNNRSMPLYAYSVCGALNILTTPEGQNWHGRFLAGEEISLDPMEKTFSDFEAMIEAGFFLPEDLDVDSDKRDENMIQRKTAMTAGEAGTIRYFNENSQDKFAFLPHYGSGDTGAWMLNLGFYFGASKELEKPDNAKKRQVVMDILDLISTEEGQQALIEDGYGLISSVRGGSVPDDPILDEVRDVIAGGRYIMRPVFYTFQTVLEPGMASFLKGEVTFESLLESCREILEQGPSQPEALGIAEADFTVLETGIYKAAALRQATETEVALVGIGEVDKIVPKRATFTKFYQGPVEADDVMRIADWNNDDPARCSRAVVSGATLLGILESGAVVEDEESGHFHPYAVSGLTLTYHLDEPEGERVSDVICADGSPLKPEKLYSISWLQDAMPEEGFSEVEHLELTLAEAMEMKIREEQKLVPERKAITFKRQ